MTSPDNDDKSKNTLPMDKYSETESHMSDDKSRSLSQLSSQQTSTNVTTNLCIVCLKNHRALAFVPCGHFAVCVPCGHGLKSCPTCGSIIKGLLRIYD